MKRFLKVFALVCAIFISANLFAGTPKQKVSFGLGVGYSYQYTNRDIMGSIPWNGSAEIAFNIPIGNFFILACPQITYGVKKVSYLNGYRKFESSCYALPINFGFNLLCEDNFALGLYLGYKPAWHELGQTDIISTFTNYMEIHDEYVEKIVNGFVIGARLYDTDDFGLSLEYVKYFYDNSSVYRSSEINLTFRYWLF